MLNDTYTGHSKIPQKAVCELDHNPVEHIGVCVPVDAIRPCPAGFHSQVGSHPGCAHKPCRISSGNSGPDIGCVRILPLHTCGLGAPDRNMLSSLFSGTMWKTFGARQISGFYVVCGVAASIAHILSSPRSLIPTVGASGRSPGAWGLFRQLPAVKSAGHDPIGVFLPVVEVPSIIFLFLWFLTNLLSGVALWGSRHKAWLGGPIGGLWQGSFCQSCGVPGKAGLTLPVASPRGRSWRFRSLITVSMKEY